MCDGVHDLAACHKRIGSHRQRNRVAGKEGGPLWAVTAGGMGEGQARPDNSSITMTSADLLLAAVINGLLLKEMAQLWRCQWTSEQLQAAALELGRCALSLGALEWGSQALAGLLKLHGATWLVGGALQALAAA